jgi:hypothetical protein
MTTTEATRWVGPDPSLRVAREVPPEVERAIVAYEHAREQRREWNDRHIRYRAAGWHVQAEDAIQKCLAYDRLMEQWWSRLEALLPREPGWYPHAGRIYGYVGKKTGFELVRHAGAWRWPDPDRTAAWTLAWSRRRGEEERVREFCGRRGG